MTGVRASTLWLLFAGLCGFHGLFAHGYVENTDAQVTMHAARAWWMRGDPGLQREGPGTWAAERAIAARIAADGTFGMLGRGGRGYVWFPIGHQLLMVPCVAAGEALAEAFPGAEETYARSLGAEGELFGRFWWTRLLVGFLPVPFAAGATVMVLLAVLALGASRRRAVLITAVATLCTQFWPGASETLSDVPGTFFLLAMAALVFRYRAGVSKGWEPFAAGVAGGWAVLVRYPHAAPVLVLAAVLVLEALRRGRARDVVLVAAGASPELVFLLLANLWRFGSVLETGYSAGADTAWFSYAPWLGIPAILLAPGKGVLWFSVPVWLALPGFFGRPSAGAGSPSGLLGRARALLRFPRLPALLVFALPVLVFGHTAGWAAGQCWGIRYVTPGVVLFVAVGLACGRPWRRCPRLFAALALLGFVISLGGVLAPYRGQQQLAFAAAEEVWPDAGQLDNNVNSAPWSSPIHTHWIYAWLAATGRLAEGGSENTTEPLFGVAVSDQEARLARPHEDAGFRHWWWLFADHLFGVSFALLLAPWLLVTGPCLGVSLRRLLRVRPAERVPVEDAVASPAPPDPG